MTVFDINTFNMIILDTTKQKFNQYKMTFEFVADSSHMAQTDVISFCIKLIAFSIDS